MSTDCKHCRTVHVVQRQLDTAQRGQGSSVSFDPGEWSRNACSLAEYYAGLGLFPAAGKCLLAAQVNMCSGIPVLEYANVLVISERLFQILHSSKL